MADQPKPGDAKARKAAADRLRTEIDDLVAGKTAPAERTSFREFIDRKMAEDAAEGREKNKPPHPDEAFDKDAPGPGRERK